MKRERIEVICFDIGGVLLRCARGWTDACRRAGVRDANLGRVTREHLGNATGAFEAGRITTDEYVECIRELTGHRPEEVRAILDAWLVELFPGIAPLLAHLRSRGVRMALLSNTNPFHWQRIQEDRTRFGALQEVRHRFASHLLGARKPDATVYEHVERAMQVDPRQILFFDDREENLNGAVWQLWQTEWIDPARDTAAQLTKYLHRHGVL